MVSFPMLRQADGKIPTETRLPVQVQSMQLIQCKKEDICPDNLGSLWHLFVFIDGCFFE